MAFFQSPNLWINQLADGVASLVLDAQGDKRNLLTAEIVAELEQALDVLAKDTRFRVLIVKSGQAGSFSAGTDPRWLAGLRTPEDFAEFVERGQRLTARLSGFALPTVAVVSGTCLGAGLELALACDYRVAVARPATVLGFNQLDTGLLPAWGGTQRLPRLVGLERGLLMLLGGRRLDASEALAWGLVDAVAEEDEPAAVTFLAAPTKRDWDVAPRHTWRQRLLETNRPGRWFITRGAARILRERLPDEMPAPWEALRAVRAGFGRPMAEGLDREREAMATLGATDAFRNLLRLHLARQERRPPQGRSDVRSVGVVGSGERGLALVHAAVTSGCQVVLHEPDRTALGLAVFQLYGLFRAEVARGMLSAARMDHCLAAIRGTTTWQHFDTVDVVLDTTDDEVPVKRERFVELQGVVGESALLVNAEAACPVAELRDGVARGDRVAGMHFVPPLGKGSLVEIARGSDTDRLTRWAGTLGKSVVEVADRPGLLVLRVLFPAFDEAARLLWEGVTAARIDGAMARFGFANGVLDYMDQLGLDAVLAVVHAAEVDAATLETGLALMLERGWRGVRSGAGFYAYKGRKRRTHRAAELLWQGDVTPAVDPGGGVPPRLQALSVADQRDLVQRRIVSRPVLEAARCLAEGVVVDAATLDFALCLAGWAPHRGGPITYARQAGRGPFLAMLSELEATYGARFAATDALKAALDDAPEPV